MRSINTTGLEPEYPFRTGILRNETYYVNHSRKSHDSMRLPEGIDGGGAPQEASGSIYLEEYKW